MEYKEFIGKRVWKKANKDKFTPKPFKSGFQVNTVKSIVISPYTGKQAFTFEEDDSIVDCYICSLAPEKNINT